MRTISAGSGTGRNQALQTVSTPKRPKQHFFSNVLRKLVQERKLTRQKVAGQFLYCAADRTRKAQQLSARRAAVAAAHPRKKIPT